VEEFADSDLKQPQETRNFIAEKTHGGANREETPNLPAAESRMAKPENTPSTLQLYLPSEARVTVMNISLRHHLRIMS